MAISDLSDKSIEELHADLRDGRITSVGLAERAIENYERHDHGLHAYKTWNPEALRAQAQVADAAFAAELDFGALQGMPVSIKDLYGVSGYPTFAGTPKALPEKWQGEGPVVGALRHGLAPVSGKTHTVEFAFRRRRHQSALGHAPQSLGREKTPCTGRIERGRRRQPADRDRGCRRRQRYRRVRARACLGNRHRRRQDQRPPLVHRGHRAVKSRVSTPPVS